MLLYIFIILSRCSLIVDNSFLLAKFEGLEILLKKNLVLSRNPQLHLALHSRFRNFVKKWCGLKVNNYGISPHLLEFWKWAIILF